MTSTAALDTETSGLEDGSDVNVVSIYDVRCQNAMSYLRKSGSRDHLIHAMEACSKFADVVTFNGNFDFKMIANDTDDVKTARAAATLALTNKDILLNFALSTGYMSSLESFASGTLGEGKTGDGAHAVAMWQAGEHDRVREYCENDARITGALHTQGMRLGRLTRVTKRGTKQTWALPLSRFRRTCDALNAYRDSPPDVSWMDEPTNYSDIADWVVPFLQKTKEE